MVQMPKIPSLQIYEGLVANLIETQSQAGSEGSMIKAAKHVVSAPPPLF